MNEEKALAQGKEKAEDDERKHRLAEAIANFKEMEDKYAELMEDIEYYEFLAPTLSGEAANENEGTIADLHS